MRRRAAIVALLVVVGGCVVLLGFLLVWRGEPVGPPGFVVDPGTVVDPATLDPWLRQEPNLEWGQWSEVPQALVAQVPEACRDEAVKRLDETPLQALTDADLKTLAPTPPAAPPDYKPYLIRCVFFKAPDGEPMRTGHFYVYRRDPDVMAFFGCLGYRSWGTGRAALVVWLPFKPENVFVVCQMAG